MMAWRIASKPLGLKKPKPAPKPSYLSWIRSLPCVLTWGDAEAAHLSTANKRYGHEGRGKAQKAADRWALPLCPDKHREQHTGRETDFWGRYGGIDQAYVTALALYAIYEEGADEDRAMRVLWEHFRVANESTGWGAGGTVTEGRVVITECD